MSAIIDSIISFNIIIFLLIDDYSENFDVLELQIKNGYKNLEIQSYKKDGNLFTVTLKNIESPEPDITSKYFTLIFSHNNCSFILILALSVNMLRNFLFCELSLLRFR